MEVACHAFFSTATVVPVELQALCDASPVRAMLKEHWLILCLRMQ
jgi:hypothetical protein